MKIVIVAPVPSNRGGISNWIKIITDNRNKFDDNEIIHLPTYKYKSSNNKRPFMEKYIKNFFDIFRVKKGFKKIISENSVDVLHITATGGMSVFRDLSLIKIAKKHKIKVVYHLHYGKINEQLAKNNRLILKILSLVDSVWCLDKQSVNSCKERFPKKKIHQVPNFIKCDAFEDKKKDNIILFIGWVVKTKGVEELIAAWQNIKIKHNNFQLKFIGPIDDDYFNFLNENYNLKGIDFLGRLDHEKTLEILGKSSIFILPSHTEGFPNVVLESMLMKTPIIATDVGAIRDILNDTGIVIPVRDEQSIFNSIVNLIKNPELRNELSNKAYQRVRNNYDITEM